MDSDDAAPAKRLNILPTAVLKRPRQLEDLSSSPHPPQPERLIYRDVVKDDDTTPPTAGPKSLRQLEDLSSSPHPPQPERLIYRDMVKDHDAPTAAKKCIPEAPEPIGNSSPHPPPQRLTSPAMNGDGAPPAFASGLRQVEDIQISPFSCPPERLSADMNCDGAPPAKKTKNSSTAFTKGLSHIENLPDDIAVDILLRLLTAEAARVSSLSRRFRTIWSLLPLLEFNCNRCPPRVGSISEALAAHDRAAEIRYLSVTLEHIADSVSSLFRHAARLVTGELCFHSLYSAQGDELDDMLDRAWRKDQDYVDMPCFDRAWRISLRLGFLTLKMPRDARFLNVKVLHLGCFGVRDKLMLSMMMFPVLQELSLKRTFGFYILDIRSDSLKKITLGKMIGLNCLRIKTPNLEVLNVFKCLEHVFRSMAEISAPKLEVFRWSTLCNPLLTSLSEMESLKLLNPPVITAFGPEEFTTNENSMTILRKFPAVEHLEVDIEFVAYNFGTHTLMQNIGFPKSEILSLHLKTSGHSSGASILNILEMCSSIKVLNLTMEDLTHVRNRCPLMCSCYNPAGWATQRSQMISLKEVTIRCLNGMNDEFKFLKVLLKLAPRLHKVKLIVGPHFQCVRQKGKTINFLDASKNVCQEIQILASLVPVGTLEVYEYVYDNKSDDFVLVPLRFDNEED